MTNKTEWFGEPRRDPVVLLDYHSNWPRLFERYKAKLREALGPVALRIDHVGSTAVSGLSAKPVIDIRVSAPDVTDEDAYRSAIEELGWPLRAREIDHRFFRPPEPLNGLFMSMYAAWVASGSVVICSSLPFSSRIPTAPPSTSAIARPRGGQLPRPSAALGGVARQHPGRGRDLQEVPTSLLSYEGGTCRKGGRKHGSISPSVPVSDAGWLDYEWEYVKDQFLDEV
jgi:GrpB-like predicted nucleotidyltransferase (UPF0157 family)